MPTDHRVLRAEWDDQEGKWHVEVENIKTSEVGISLAHSDRYSLKTFIKIHRHSRSRLRRDRPPEPMAMARYPRLAQLPGQACPFCGVRSHIRPDRKTGRFDRLRLEWYPDLAQDSVRG